MSADMDPKCIKKRGKWYVLVEKEIVAGPYVNAQKAERNWRAVAWREKPDPPDTKHGGTRPGAGRKKLPDKVVRAVTITRQQLETAERLGDQNVSRGVRRALDMASGGPDTG